ncbi:hypothetical protein [Clostridium tunisiense]|uniref:hypothetical protein n=1 Tax=Clostridium tunisiense TaxID=219748 RepID=UPI0002F10B7D|nr:hypothetical protein [Clostridium tunisiense]
MKNLPIDMELLSELISEDTRGEGECYLDTNSGELSYIPLNVLEALEDNSKLINLEDWEKDLINEAINILSPNKQQYLHIPIVEEDFTISVMKEYTFSLTDNMLRDKLLNSLKDANYSHKFNSILLREGDIDNFYDFKDYRYYEYIQRWLLKNGIKNIE